MAIDFPASPALNQTYTFGDRKWIYNGSGWQLQPAGNGLFTAASAASTPSVYLSGAWFTGGTGTTTKPHLLIEPTGTTSTGWSTSGTGFGVNAPSGFTGRLLDLQVNGSTVLQVTTGGNVGINGTPSNTAGFSQQFEVAGALPCISLNNTGTGSGKYVLGINGSGNLGIWDNANSVYRCVVDSSGRLLVGAAAARTNFGNTAATSRLQVEGINGDTGRLSVVNNFSSATNGAAGQIVLARSGATSLGSNTVVANNNWLGLVSFQGSDGTEFVEAAEIKAEVDGAPGANNMPGRLIFSTTADGASSPTERLRITNDGIRAYNQPAPAAVNATATLTIANLKTGIITSTSAAATDMTLPTGTLTEGGFVGIYTNLTFEWSVINTGPSLVRILDGTGHTVTGSNSVAAGTSARFASRRTASNTFVCYRLS